MRSAFSDVRCIRMTLISIVLIFDSWRFSEFSASILNVLFFLHFVTSSIIACTDQRRLLIGYRYENGSFVNSKIVDSLFATGFTVCSVFKPL